MTVTPSEPLSPTAISLVLEYIAPPSLLAPLPPHLISDSLAQRHRFLNITPDDPSQYLAWPSDSIPNAQQLAVDLLESVQKQESHHPVYPVRYTTDPESAFAHAAISTQNPPGLRLVFQWAPSDGWKFHNLSLMPFPPNSCESVHDMIAYRPYDFLHEPSVADEQRGSYWDAYDLSDDEDDQRANGHSKPEHESGTEDAYWAQYSAVHGSGDSARPTPPTVNRNLDNERVILAYPDHRTSSAYNPLAPPSPKVLATLLANLPPRTSSPHLLDDSDSGFGSASVSNNSTSLPLSPASRPSEVASSSDVPSALLSTAMYTPSLQMSSAASQAAKNTTVDDDARRAVKDTIRGVYRLWKAGKVIDSAMVDEDKEEFLDIVRQALIPA
ncbi:hypothetical protein H0H87_000186 [Tephrocybe sp. NHM501043]|nr:hypothetical protein H0H87_000186 [Tephrocybe sp. NHM501043]